MAAFDQIGKALARAGENVARSLGVGVVFSHRGAAGISLKARLLLEEIASVTEGGVLTERRVLVLAVPTQAGFAVATNDTEPVTPGDTITYLGRTYHVLDPILKRANGHVYVLRCAERKRLASGV